MKVYLAGGMKSDWQDKLMRLAPGHTYFDPRSHGLNDPKDYTDWDLRHVRLCDVLVAQMDSSNPSGFGLCLEVGYASALGKRVIFIDEIKGDWSSRYGDWRSRYFDMVRCVAECFPSIDAVAAALMVEAGA